MSASLDTIVTDYKERHGDKFPILRQSAICKSKNGRVNKRKLKSLLNGKSVLPYEKISTPQWLVEQKTVPSIENYWSSLKDKNITKLEHDNVKRFFKSFGFSDMSQFACT